jgi:hypothetical protein
MYVMQKQPNDEQTSLRLPRGLRVQLDAQAYAHGRSLAAELRGAAQISMAVRALYLLRHDGETCRRLGTEVPARRLRAEETLDSLCSRLFGPDVAIQDLLSEAPTGARRNPESVP